MTTGSGETVQHHADATDSLSSTTALLNEWFHWWLDSDDVPAKMPNALHVRTAIALGYESVLDL